MLDAVRRFGDKATMQQVVIEGFAESTSVLRENPTGNTAPEVRRVRGQTGAVNSNK